MATSLGGTRSVIVPCTRSSNVGSGLQDSSDSGPHGLRATFVTLALEGGAPLHLVQRAAGHADPRTTERYWRRKEGLDDNAVDYIRL